MTSQILIFQGKGYEFESDTDTEVIAKLIHHIHANSPVHNFRELVETVIQQVQQQQQQQQ